MISDPGFWDARYSKDGFAYGDMPDSFLMEAKKFIPRGRVLCLAEGEGRNAVYLAGQGYQVTAVDWSAAGLKKAERLAAGQGLSITTIVADLSTFEIEPGHWEGIVAMFAHLPPKLRGKVHRASAEGLRPGGVFLLEAYSPHQVEFGTGGPPNPEMLMPLDVLREELKGLELVVARETVRGFRGGQYHFSQGAVVQIVGVKLA